MPFSRRWSGLAVLLAGAFSYGPANAAEVTFEKDVRPILKAMCFQCHGEEPKPKGKLDLRLVRLMHAGGTSGAAVVAGKPAESPLWERIESDEMPEGVKKLTPAQKATIKKWIEQGAKTSRVEPADVAAARFSDEELSHWAWQPVRNPAVPAVGEPRTPIDAFLLARLKEKGIAGYSREADKRTLIRRITFDLTGLPPTPAEVATYFADETPEAWGRLVDRLLASPRYGERWGRHWLDVAGYAETDGNTGGLDHPRPHAWKYRDYVVRSFNSDKPYDRFVREQLAGDELAPKPLVPSDPNTAELLTATGFLRMAPDVTQATDSLVDRTQALAETVKVVSSAVMGVTVGCAQCHDHRYDPILQDDYTRLRAVFDPAFDVAHWRKPTQRTVDATTKAAREAADKIEAKAKAMEADIRTRERAHGEKLFDLRLNKVPDIDREPVGKIVDVPEDKLTPGHKALLAKYPGVKPLAFIVATLEEYDKPMWLKFEAEKKKLAAIRATKPEVDLRMVPGEQPDYKGESRFLFRGDPQQPKHAVTPADLFVSARHRASTADKPGRDIPPRDPQLPTTGRRLRLAEMLTDGTHPLTARVIVNRVWLLHFGKGIVNTPADFGIFGERPTHPELLDHLATSLMDDGWSLKRLHRRILMTTAYRQQSVRTPELDRIDPDNRLLGRMSVRRVEAEAVRDSLLLVSGKLNPEMYGPSVAVTEDESGRGVIGRRELSSFGKPYGPFEAVASGQEYRRSLYVSANRSIPLTMLETFDLPVMQPNCDLRRCSIVPPQALMFLNDEAIVKCADELTERMWKEANDPPSRVEALYRVLFAAEVSADEKKACEEFVRKQTDYFRVNGSKDWLETVKKWSHAPDMRAFGSLCQTLLSSNRFLYVD